MSKGMNPAKRRAMRARAEYQDQVKKNARLGLKPTKKGKRK